ncbi:MAG TPA: gas vesicle protein GvpO [Natronosporangium sp.]
MADQPQSTDRIDAREAARRAVAHVTELAGQAPEVVSGLEPTDDGWLVTVELLELSRVPDTTDVLGCYQVTIGPDGEPRGYRRVRRYHRGRVGEEPQ